MDFSLTTLFVVPVGNTIPSSGSTQDLTAGVTGLFAADYTDYTAGVWNTTIPYFYIAQGRENTYTLATKRSDKISPAKVVEWYKVTGTDCPRNEIWDICNWNIKCGELVTVSIRAHSSYIDTGFFNGLTRSVTVQAPCCDCDGDPCETVDECALVQQFVDKFNSQIVPLGIKDGTRLSLTQFFTFESVTTGENTCCLRITGKPLDVYGNPCDVAAFPWEYDRLWFRTWAFKGADTTQDFLVWDSCDVAADTTLVQRSTYVHGTSEEIQQMEKDFYSYQTIHKHLFRLAGYNQMFESYVTAGTTYSLFTIKCREFDQQNTWGDFVPYDFTVLLAVPVADEGTWETILDDVLGVPLDKSGCVLECTTTTTTTGPTTTTTSTTQPIP